MTKTKNIVISGTNFWNPGDDFVRDGVIRILHELFPGYQLNFLFYNFNQDFFPQNKFTGIHNMAAEGDLDQYKGFIDYVVIAGLSAGTEIKDLYNWIIKNDLTDRVFLIGAGYENDYVDKHIRQEPELTIFKNARVITGRTSKAPEIIKELGLPFHHINCPAILSVPAVKNISPDKKLERLAFSIQLPHEFGILNHACAKEMYLLSIQLISELTPGYEIEVIAHHKSEYFHFLNLFKKHNVNIPVIFSSYYQDLFEIYKNYDAIITTRLHSSLFANGFGIPGIILNDTDRHTYCLEGFPHSVWVNSKEKFYHEFEKLKKKDLAEIANEAGSFKKQLLAKYVVVLKDKFNVSKTENLEPLKSKDILKINNENNLLALPANLDLPVHFFTIVLNGKPFIDYHINVFKNLPFKWHWHIVEGVADLKNDTAWSLQNGAQISKELHNNGVSNDGTSEYLDELKKQYSNNITIYRKGNSAFWNGKLEMVNAPLQNIKEECVLWEIDVDELWTTKQLIRGRQIYINHPKKTASYYFCHFLVGEKLAITSMDTYGNHTSYEWLRTWRYMPGDRWMSHEPPRLCRKSSSGEWKDLGKVNPFMHDVTSSHNLVFQHYAYVLPTQLGFKEKYYGYKNALSQWNNLQKQRQFPVLLKNYFDWVDDEAVVDLFEKYSVQPLAYMKNWDWEFYFPDEKEGEIKKILFLRPDSIGDNIIASSMLEPINRKYPDAGIILLCQDHIAELYENVSFINEIIPLDKTKYNSDINYKKEFNNKLKSLKIDILLNTVYSREPITDDIVKQINAEEIIGFSGDTSNIGQQELEQNNLFYSKLIVVNDKQNELEKYSSFLDELGIEHGELKPAAFICKEEDRFAEEYLSSKNINPDKVISLFPYTQWSIKDYNNFSTLLNSPDFSGNTFLILGGKENFEKSEELVSNAANNVYNLAGKTSLLQTAALIKKSKLLVGSDTSGSHIACAVDTPNVVVMGGGHFGRFMPYSNLTSLVTNPIICYGCNWKCKFDKAYCINDISSALLVSAVKDALHSKSGKARIYFSDNSNSGNVKASSSIISKYLSQGKTELKHIPVSLSSDKNEVIQFQNLPRISVITPSFNQASYIEQTIKSVLDQNYPNFEHIIIDGGSTDGTINILKKYPHLNWVSEKDRGQSDALNKGFNLANGEIVAWINSDDWYEPGTFIEAARFFEENECKNVVMGNCNLVDEDGKIFDRVINYERGFEELRNYKVPRSIPTQPAIFFRKKILEEVGLLDLNLRYTMDYDLWMRFSKKDHFFHINRTFANYRFHKDAKIGDRNWEKIYPECERIKQKYDTDDENPLVSVIIPCYNYAKYLPEAVNSVVNQSYSNWEIIIVNDGSTDNTIDVAHELISSNPKRKIKLISQDNSGNPAVSRNSGIAESNGKYILPLDADDILAKDALKLYVDAAGKSTSKNIVVYGWLKTFDATSNLWQTRNFQPYEILRKTLIPYCSMFHRSVWQTQNGYSTNVGYEDWDFWIGAVENGTGFINLPQITTLRRETENNSRQKSDRKKHELNIAGIIKNHQNSFEDEEIKWATFYLNNYVESVNGKIHQAAKELYPSAVSILVFHYPELYDKEEVEWAKRYLTDHPFEIRKGIQKNAANNPGLSKQDWIVKLVNKGVDDLKNNRCDEALVNFNEALRFAPGIPEIRYGKAVALANVGKIKDARGELEEILKIKPDHVQARQFLVEINSKNLNEVINN